MTREATEDAHRLIVSSSPHVHSGASVRRIMLDVIIALVPALAVSVVFFGLDSLRLVTVCVSTCILAEAVCRKAMGREQSVHDLSAVVTGVLLALTLPPSLPTATAVIGSLIAIIIAKQIFGGLGYNSFNPALVARAVLLVSRPAEMTTWSAWQIPQPVAGFDAITHATPLGYAKTAVGQTGVIPYVFDASTACDFFVGKMNGCIGEVSVAALLLGGAYLLWRRCIRWQTPVFFVGTVFVLAALLRMIDPATNMSPVLHVLAGGLALGAIFMATDMVTTPVTRSGMAIFGVGCGILTVLIRKWGALPEGVCFSILVMNALTPLIDRATRPRAYGHKGRGAHQ